MTGQVISVGSCASCGSPVLRKLGFGAECACGKTTIPQLFFTVGMAQYTIPASA